MPTCCVDEMWHQLISKQKEYKKFCESKFGTYIDHVKSSGHGPIEWIDDYHSRYGALPILWFYSSIYGINEEVMSEYIQTGKYIFSWDCDPLDVVPKLRKPNKQKDSRISS